MVCANGFSLVRSPQALTALDTNCNKIHKDGAIMNLKDYIGKYRKQVALAGVFSLILLAILASVGILNKEQTPTSITDIAIAIREGQVASIQDTADNGRLLILFKDGSEKKSLRDRSNSLVSQLRDLGVTSQQLSEIEIEVVQSGMSTASKGVEIALPLVFLGVIGFVVVRMNRTGISQKNFQKGEIPNVTFAEVAGIEETVEELRDVVAFLRNGDSYTEVGAKTPRGILLVGDPGTGKTLLARAVAGEAGVPFFPISGAEFVEVFVGVGAGRVRSLFRRARKSAPCIVFIDEIDAVGRTRRATGSGGEMEQDQTLNQLLIEMDGFSAKENVIVLGATNREDVLDPALMRPGRFDRKVRVEAPDIAGREAILNVHARGKKLAPEVNLGDVAKATPGLVGADLENVVNEAAIYAVRLGHREITQSDFQAAVEKILTGGVEQKSRVIHQREREIIAYHEAGHAVVTALTEMSDPVYKISIIPRGRLGGFTMSLPEQDRMLISKNQILARVTVLMGGRAAEEIFFQDITSGAANDLSVATNLAEDMVMRLGMGTAGLRVFPRKEGCLAFTGAQQSPRTAEEIDSAVESILASCYEKAKRIIKDQKNLIEQIAAELLETETMSRERFEQVMSSVLSA
jgi:cell division protease FtsH